MPLSPGDKLGSYEILSLLGKGGMGEVYRARDPKLNRGVAIKVLPLALANDADYLARFQREAQTLASLNHPNIASIYGLEANAIVMELVEGDTLQGPLPMAEALPIAKQIAEALEAAHDKGIIHRDLKPGNIKLTPEGIVKVLDFGLAKAVAERSTQTGPDSPTLTMRATEAGLILGTAAYMSPEQAAGKPVDRRADIWSFGVVLHELLTGKRVFDGETVSHTLAHVLTAHIDLAPIPAGPIRELIGRCLDRNLKTRLRDIGEARIAIENYLANPAQAEPTAQPLAPAQRWPWAVSALLLAALASISWLYFRQTPPELRVVNTALLPPDNTDFDFTRPHAMPAISPDGTRIVFGAKAKDGKTQLWLRRLDSPFAQLLPGTEGAATPFWSPDSRWIAFGQDRKLRKIDIQGGPPVAIADIPAALRGGSWNREGVIVFGVLNAAPILRVSASGGAPAPITGDVAQPGIGRTNRHPCFLPDGRHFLYQSSSEIIVASLDEPRKPGKALFKTDSPAVFAQGHLLYLRENTLMAQPFDPDRLEAKGEAVPVAEGVPTYTTGSNIPGFAVSPAGLLVYQAGGTGARSRLVWKDRQGKLLDNLGPPADQIEGVELSPDGKQVAASLFDRASRNDDIWIYDVARGIPTRFTFDPRNDTHAAWSPDGKSIYFTSDRNGRSAMFRKAANGAGAEELIETAASYSSVSPDGKLLLFQRNEKGSGPDLWYLPLTTSQGSGKPEPRVFLKTPFSERRPRFSPDGQWVLYSSDESGSIQIYAAPFPGPGGKRQISSSSGAVFYARWRRDGREIFFLEENRLMAAEVAVRNGTLEVGQVRKLLEGFSSTFNDIPYDVTADGQKILVVDAGIESTTRPLTLLQNWTAALKN